MSGNSESVAKEIYWAAYDQYLGPEYRHPCGFDKDTAWSNASEIQRRFCMHQAERAMAAMS